MAINYFCEVSISGGTLSVSGSGSGLKLLHVGDGSATLGAPQGAEIEGYNNTLDVKTNEQNNISDFTPAINLFCDGVTGSSGTGTGIYFRAKTGAGGSGEYTEGRIQGAVYTSWTTNTDATRTSKLVIQTTNSGTHADRVTILGNGNLGIGTTTPTYLLDVNEDDNVLAFRVTGGGGGAPMASFVRDVGATGSQVNINASDNFPQIQFTNTGNTFSIGGDTSGNFKISDANAIGTNDRITIDNTGNVGIGTTDPEGKLHIAGISDSASGLVLEASGTGDNRVIDFQNTAGALRLGLEYDNANINLNLVDRNRNKLVTFREGGNVGIGTDSPGEKLDVNGVIRAEQYLRLADTGGTNRFSIRAESTYGTIDNGSNTLNYNANSHLFLVGLSEKMRITNTGDVGIGTTSPSEKLEVNGTVKATDYKGYLPAFQHGGFLHSTSASSTTVYWIPTNNVGEVTSSQYYNNWVAPYDGRVKKIIMRWTGSGAAPTATSVTFRYAVNATTSSSTFPATVVDGASTNMTATKAFGDTDITFNASDRVQLGFTTNGGTRLLQGFAYTVVLEYNKD
jgi:hypothetical protein